MSFIYEVNLEVDEKIAERFSKWLTPHIEEMLSFEGFLAARWLTRSREDEGIEKSVVLWTIQYTLDKKSSYTNYVNTHAQRMRKDGLNHFGGSFHATRRLLQLHSNFTNQS